MAEREKNGQEGIFCACGNRGDVPGERVNLRRIREKLDALEAAGDTEGAARLLNYWIAEAQFIGDRTGEALLENEFVGMYRKAGRGAEALRHGDRALSLLEAGGLEDTVTAGTTRINVATACTAFGQEERACLLFEQARKIYEARLDATDEEVIQAAKTASAHSFIMRLSDGYNTVIEGDGANLSQGQRQLLNIARAAISKAPILVLDEATSSVDTRTERHIEHGLQRLMNERTTFIIAHRLSTVRNANAIMVLEDGVIIERGDHEDLLAQKGRYYELYTGKRELA